MCYRDDKNYANVICESDCLKAVGPFVACHDQTLHAYATNILHIIDALHENDNTILAHAHAHALRKQNTYANYMTNEGSHSRCYTQ